MQHRFASLGKSRERLYAWDTENYAEGGIDHHARQCDTYGDGNVQHSHWYSVADTAKDASDYLASFASYVFTTLSGGEGSAAEITSFVAYLGNRYDEATLEWALSVKANKDKPTYFNVSEKKVSSAENKRHDRRWNKVPECCDGGIAGAMRILGKEFDSPLDGMLLWDQLREARWQATGERGESVATWRWKLDQYSNESRALSDALELFRRACRAGAALFALKRGIECYTSNNVKAEPAKAEEPAVA